MNNISAVNTELYAILVLVDAIAHGTLALMYTLYTYTYICNSLVENQCDHPKS